VVYPEGGAAAGLAGPAGAGPGEPYRAGRVPAVPVEEDDLRRQEPAMLNYVDKIVRQLEEVLDDCDIDLLRHYALLVLLLGEDVVERDVHDAWSVWRTASKPDHVALVPFDELTREVQDLDTPYAEAIIKVAGQLAEKD
jgi:hypothetical protein